MNHNSASQDSNPRKRARDTSPTRPIPDNTPMRAQSNTATPTLLQRLSDTQTLLLEPSTDDVTYPEQLPRAFLDHALGRVFNQSFVSVGDGEHFQAAIHVRTGIEPVDFLHPEDSFSVTVGHMLNRAALSIVNQPTGVPLSVFAEDVSVTLGQVVLLMTERELFIGVTSVYDGPYIFVAQHGDQCALINEDGRFHPVLVPFSALRPYHSSWHIYALPSTVSQHPALQELLATARDPQQSQDN